MYCSDNRKPRRRASQQGFSLIEVLIVLIISAMLMSLFAQVYLGAERSHQKLREFVGDNRSAFYTRQQLRARIIDITFPEDWGTSLESALGVTSESRRSADVEQPALRGEANRINGVMWDRFASDQRRRNFSLEIVAPESRLRSRHIGQVKLTFDDAEGGVVLPLSREAITAFQYVDVGGVIHESWPPIQDPSTRQRLSARASNSLSDYLRSANAESGHKRLPRALLIQLEGPFGASALLFEIAG